MDRPSNSATRGNDQVSVADSPSSVRTAQSTGQALLERIDRAWEEVVEQFTDLMELEQNGTPASSHKTTGTPLARVGSGPSEPRHAAMRAAPVLPATPPAARSNSRTQQAWEQLLDDVQSWVADDETPAARSTREPLRAPAEAPEVSVIIPSLGRQLAVDSVIESSLAAFPSCEIITVMADGRPHDFSQGWAQSRDHFHELKLWKRQGWGAAIRIGLMQASGEYVVIQPPHRSLSTSVLESLLEPLRHEWADVTCLSQFHRDGFPFEEKGNWRDRWGETMVSWILEQFTELNLTQPLGGAKAIRRELLTDLTLKSTGDAAMIELLVRLQKRRARIQEIPERVSLLQRPSTPFMNGRILRASLGAILRYGWGSR